MERLDGLEPSIGLLESVTMGADLSQKQAVVGNQGLMTTQARLTGGMYLSQDRIGETGLRLNSVNGLDPVLTMAGITADRFTEFDMASHTVTVLRRSPTAAMATRQDLPVTLLAGVFPVTDHTSVALVLGL